MIYSNFQDMKLSRLGFGAMRLPLLENGEIDEAELERMTACAMERGVNYFDTAYPYHDGKSEIAIGRALGRYPRDTWYLATKFPGHQISESYDPAAVFEEQLEKCGVDYFDFYLLHNVYENSIDTYLDPQWGILDYFKEQKRLGRIRHLGFSCHGGLELMERFLDVAGNDMEFCQIQLNYLDWTLQNGKQKVDLLNRRNIPIWVMEPVRGGKLCSLGESAESRLRALRPEASAASWGFRFLQDIPGVTVILSGMSNLAQMQDNLATFDAPAPLSEAEAGTLMSIAEGMKNSVPCTACRYCVEQCPLGLDIPMMIAAYNDLCFATSVNVSMRLECLPPEKQPSACLSCGKCAKMCPQLIPIPDVMKKLTAKLEKAPRWTEVSSQREAAAERLRQEREEEKRIHM